MREQEGIAGGVADHKKNVAFRKAQEAKFNKQFSQETKIKQPLSTFKEYRKQLTYMHKLLMESNMVHPASYMELMHDVKQWIRRSGLEGEIQQFLTKDGNIAEMPYAKNEIYGWLEGQTGWSIDPMTFTRFNKVRVMRDMIESGIKLKESRDIDKEGLTRNNHLNKLKEELVNGKCKNIVG